MAGTSGMSECVLAAGTADGAERAAVAVAETETSGKRLELIGEVSQIRYWWSLGPFLVQQRIFEEPWPALCPECSSP